MKETIPLWCHYDTDLLISKEGVEMKEETRRITLRLPISVKSYLERKSKNMGISLNALIAHILWDYLEEAKNKTDV